MNMGECDIYRFSNVVNLLSTILYLQCKVLGYTQQLKDIEKQAKMSWLLVKCLIYLTHTDTALTF